MTALDWIENGIGWLGGAFALAALILVYLGVVKGLRRPVGVTGGRVPGIIRSPLFYAIASLLFIGAAWLLWRPVVVLAAPALRIAALVLGTLLYFPGLGLIVWGRLALGKEYFVSSGVGAQLEEWANYARRVPRFFPRLCRK